MKKLFFLLTVIFTVSSFSQMKFQGRLDDLRNVRVIDELNLNEEKTAKYLTLDNKFRDDMKSLDIKVNYNVDKLRNQLESNLSESDIQKSIEMIETLENDRISMRVNFVKELKKNFTNKEFAQYVLIVKGMNDQIRHKAKQILKENIKK